MPKVSIVLPSYNGSVYIKKSIESVVAQEYTDWELIIVDDCSTDETLQIAHTYAEKDARIKVHHNETNQKLPESLNIGFRQATGEYFTWTSDDNWYMENAIGTMVGYLDIHPETGLCYADYYTVNDEDSITGESRMSEPKHIITENVVGACFLYRRDVAQAAGEYDKSLFLAEDYDYWMRVSRQTKFAHISELLYYYRQHDNSLTQTRWQEAAHAVTKIWDRNWDDIMNHLGRDEERDSFLRKYYTFCRDKKEALRKVRSENRRLAMEIRLENLRNAYPKYLFWLGRKNN